LIIHATAMTNTATTAIKYQFFFISAYSLMRSVH
jgi:hypothetical protein